MKPRTKLQKAVVKSSETLPPLTEYQRQQAIKHASIHIAKLDSKGNYVCLECGHQWRGDKSGHVVCPECGAKLKVDTSRKWNFRDSDCFALVRQCNGFQVIRVFYITSHLRKGRKAVRWINEAFQRWITPAGDNLIISRKRNWPSCYCDSWDWGSDLELRSENYGHSVNPCLIIGQRTAIPELVRNGFDGKFHECSAVSLFNALLSDNRVETLWKVGQYELVRYFLKSGLYNMECFWPSIKIALRHHYHIEDGSMWCDTLRFIKELGKDVRNPKLICPDNLRAAHDEWQHRVETRRDRERERQARQRELADEQRYISNVKQMMQDQHRYKKAKSKFFDLVFVDKDLSVKPLVSIQEFIDEGKLHHHCVFVCKYFNKAESLIFHALINGTSVATIEFNLQTLEVVQCRGKFNSKPEQYDRIVALINKNKGKIAQKLTA